MCYMISIPIWLFIILLFVTSITLIVLVSTIISYAIYCKRKNNAIRKEIDRKYGTRNGK